ncbi:MAG TPA: GNAT family N-acetyltransferase [Chthonomonadaceae bacterium]|nr:GNAT family N-acetyltransferase [Chthonomonadaceae bacterium]
MQLTTNRLLLRPFEKEDFDAVYAFRSDEQVMRYWTVEPETAEEVRDFLQRVQEYPLQKPQLQFRFAVVLRAENRVIGGSGFGITNPNWREGEIGYHLHRGYWGRGYGTEAAGALVKFGFEHLKLHRIFAECFPENPASSRVMEKIGMKREAYLRQNKWIAGQWHDTLVYAMLDAEYQQP